jgi:uncharacterized protein YjbI with pentapeptide repeats
MDKNYTEGKNFSHKNFTENTLPVGEYENCTFLACVFAQADLGRQEFTNCTFEDCDMSMAKLKNTVFKQAIFKNCKMLGLRFEDCNPFLLEFILT